MSTETIKGRDNPHRIQPPVLVDHEMNSTAHEQIDYHAIFYEKPYIASLAVDHKR